MDAVAKKKSLERPRSVAPFGTYPPSILHRLARTIGERLPRSWLGVRVSGPEDEVALVNRYAVLEVRQLDSLAN